MADISASGHQDLSIRRSSQREMRVIPIGKRDSASR